jgi:RNA 3'-terminal phosphate cyclase (ATP)
MSSWLSAILPTPYMCSPPFGRLGVSAEQVADEAIQQAQGFVRSRVVVHEHLAEKISLPMALPSGGSFSTSQLSDPSRTNRTVITAFLNTQFDLAPLGEDGSCEVRVVLQSKRSD